MENSMLRPSLVRYPTQTTRKDGSRVPSRVEAIPQPRYPAQFRRKVGHRAAARHSLSYVNYDMFEGTSSNSQIAAPVKVQACFSSESLADGYAHASSQLRLCPGSLPKFKSSSDEIPCWDLVAEVYLISETTLRCPICLSAPIVPRMERCAHVYCGPCAVQYILYENDFHSKKCAVCSWVMHLQDLKRVAITYVDALKVGSRLDMSLIRRLRNQNTCFVETDTNVSNFSAFDRVVELKQTDVSLSNLRDLETLTTLKSDCVSLGDTELLPHINWLLEQMNIGLKMSKVDTSTTHSTLVTMDSRTEALSEDTQVYYQASDGRLIFLDGLMWACLLSEFGLTNLPKFLTVSVTSIRNHKMTPTSRRRWRHLSHVPNGHWFTFIEIDLNSLVSRRVLEQFSSSLRARSEERNRKLLEDLRLTELKEAAENQVPHLPPGFVLAGHAELPDSPNLDSFPQLGSPRWSSAQPNESMATAHERPITTFAEVTKAGARSVVDQNRIANFSRSPTEPALRKSFNPATEVWPSLSASSKAVTCDVSNDSTDQSTSQSENPQSIGLAFSRSKRRRKKQMGSPNVM